MVFGEMEEKHWEIIEKKAGYSQRDIVRSLADSKISVLEGLNRMAKLCEMAFELGYEEGYG